MFSAHHVTFLELEKGRAWKHSASIGILCSITPEATDSMEEYICSTKRTIYTDVVCIGVCM